MRRILILLVAVLTLLALSVPAGATTETTQLNVHAAVTADSTCQIAITSTVHLDTAVESLFFPLPEEASSISLNGSWARTRMVDGVRCIDLSRVMGGFAGDFSFTINYTLQDQVEKDKDGILHLQVPLMSGFPYPTRSMEFTITLPGNITTKPGFSSGYHQTGIEQDLSYTIDGAIVTGRSQKTLKDHETLEMILPVTEEMFPQNTIAAPDLEEVNIITIVVAVLAALYWLVFLRCLPWLGRSQSTPPEGYSAGHMHSILHLQGTDMTLMIFTWAQLGYVILEYTRSGKVRIYKQMEMGNERSALERRAFQNLFAGRQAVDTSSLRYSELWQKIHRLPPDIGSFIHRRSGNLKIFRVLCALVGLCSGISMGIVIGNGAALQWPLAALLAIVGFGASYLMQPWVSSLFSSDRSHLYSALALAALWLIPAIILQHAYLGLTGAASGILGGIFLFCGGRRTEAGYRALLQVGGLYRYFRIASRKELQEILQANPEYFFDLVPYALALGADRAFARRFGSIRLPECPYVRAGRTENMTPLQWSDLMRDMQQAMDNRRKHSLRERIYRFAGSFIK